MAGVKVARLISARDVVNATLFAGLAPAAWLLPQSTWSPLASACASLHIRLRGSAAPGSRVTRPSLRSAFLRTRWSEACSPDDTKRFCKRCASTDREDGAGPSSWSGRNHLDDALALGRGAVLWVAPCNFAELNVKKALHSAGYAVTNLRSHIHPYSGTHFGRAVLNRVRTSVEDRFLSHTVTLHSGNGASALRELQSRLRDSGVVSITANSAGERPARLPFLDGTLTLALGAAALARMAKAPLLPVFALPARSSVYQVELQAPLSCRGDAERPKTRRGYGVGVRSAA